MIATSCLITLGLCLGAPDPDWIAVPKPGSPLTQPGTPNQPPSSRENALRRILSLGRDETKPEDEELLTQLRKSLWNDPELSPFNLVVTVQSGLVTVYGPVGSAYHHQRAIALLEQNRNVKGVKSQIRVTGEMPASRERAVGVRPTGESRPGMHHLFPSAPGTTPAAPSPRLLVPIQEDSPPRVSSDLPAAQRVPVPQPPAQPSKAPLPAPPPVSTGGGVKSLVVGRSSDTDDVELAYSVDRVLRGNFRFRAVSFQVDLGRLILRGRVATQAEREDLLAAVRHLAPDDLRVDAQDLLVDPIGSR